MSNSMYVSAPPAKSTVRGKVLYEDTGKAVRHASITLINEDENGRDSVFVAITDSEGDFQVNDVRAGTYYPIINSPGIVLPMAFLDLSKPVNGGHFNEREALKEAFGRLNKIIVDGINSINVQVFARRGAAIGGRVIYDDGDPAIGVKIEIFRKVEDKFISVMTSFPPTYLMTPAGNFQTDDRGIYRVSGLPPGEYIVKVTENTSHSENTETVYSDMLGLGRSRHSFLTIFYPEALEAESAQIINVLPGQEVSEINLTIPDRSLYKLEGRLIARKDKSPVKARIIIKKEGGEQTYSISDVLGNQQQIALTDENGNWKFKELPKGNYKLLIEPMESDGYNLAAVIASIYSNSQVRNIQTKPHLAKTIEKFTIEDKDLKEIVIELGYGAAISGIVTVENSKDFPENIIVAAINDKDESTEGRDSWSPKFSNDGNNAERPVKNDFKLEDIPEGKTRLLILVKSKGFYVKSAISNGVDLLDGPFELKEGEVLQNVQILLGKDVGTLKGAFLDDKKEPVRNLQLAFVPTDLIKRKNASFYHLVKTGENGEFEVSAAAGEYAIIFFDKAAAEKERGEYDKWLDETIKDAQKVKIETGKTETISLRKSK